MGTCETTCCGEKDTEVDTEISGELPVKGGRAMVGEGTDADNGKWGHYKKHIKRIIALQSLYRMNKATEKVNHMRLANRGTSRYFTPEEASETINSK